MINKEFHKQISHSFYIDLRINKKRKLRRCSLCSSGPYVEEDENKDIFELLPDVRYCLPCMKLHNYSIIKKNTDLKEESEQDSEVIPEERKNIKENEPIKKNDDTWYVFEIKCKDTTTYKGITQNLEKAVKYINKLSGPKSLRIKEKLPIKLIKFKSAPTKKGASELKKEL